MKNVFENYSIKTGIILKAKIEKDYEIESFSSVLSRVKRNLKLKQIKFLVENCNPFFRIKKNKLWYNLRGKQRKLLADELEKKKYIKIEEDEEVYLFDKYRYCHPLGFFAGRKHFSFRVNFKEYKAGLKPAKFSLLLNQFKINIELFIEMISNILDDNFITDFYKDFFKEDYTEVDFKIHFLIIIYTKARKNTISRFYIIPKGIIFVHLRKLLWDVLFTDIFFLESLRFYHKGFKKSFGLMFMLLTYYIDFLINMKLYNILNKNYEYDFETRTYDSLGNFLCLKINSFKLFTKTNFLITKGSYIISRKCLANYMSTSEETLVDSFNFLKELNFLEKDNFNFEKYYDLSLLNEDLLCQDDF